jgi:cobalt-zinc-cadmium efflux system outer membrane protein
MNGIRDNYIKRNVSTLEFVDFFEAYNDAAAASARIRLQLAVAAEQLNLSVGKDNY